MPSNLHVDQHLKTHQPSATVDQGTCSSLVTFQSADPQVKSQAPSVAPLPLPRHITECFRALRKNLTQPRSVATCLLPTAASPRGAAMPQLQLEGAAHAHDASVPEAQRVGDRHLADAVLEAVHGHHTSMLLLLLLLLLRL